MQVWIFCHSLDTDTLIRLAQNVREKSPGSKLIYVSGAEPLDVEAALFHRIVEPSMGLIALLAAVREFTLPME